jgi:hypothetical protein
MAESVQIIAYDGGGERVKDFIIEPDEGLEFYAHQLLHVDGVICVQIFPLGAPGQIVEALLTRCDPGVDFGDIVDLALL